MTRDYAVLEEIKASSQEILNCSYSKWYPLFKDHTASSMIIPLTQEFIHYLSSESIHLPDPPRNVEGTIEEILDEDSESDDDEEWETEPRVDPTKDFPMINEFITKALDKYTYVTPKLNWSAPKDASWIMIDNTLKCRNINDVYLLLKSSDHITHDLDHPFDESSDTDSPAPEYELVLRKWKEINPSLEFRVFVRNGVIVGKSQRDLNYYDFLKNLIEEEKINDVINDFVNTEVIPKFQNRSFIIDIYVPRPYKKIRIIDINPFTRVTDSILYTWPELINDQEDNIRLITETNIGRFRTKAYSESQVPLDVVNASADPGALAELAKEWQINEKTD